MDSGVTDLLIRLAINVVILISFFLGLLLTFRWRRRRKEEEAKTSQEPTPQPVEQTLPVPELTDLASLPPADASQDDDDDQLPDWLTDPD